MIDTETLNHALLLALLGIQVATATAVLVVNGYGDAELIRVTKYLGGGLLILGIVVLLWELTEHLLEEKGETT